MQLVIVKVPERWLILLKLLKKMYQEIYLIMILDSTHMLDGKHFKITFISDNGKDKAEY